MPVQWDEEAPPAPQGGGGVQWDTPTPEKPDTRGPVMRAYQDYVAKPVTNVVAQGIQGLAGAGLPVDPRMQEVSPEGHSIAEAIVPQTPLQAGAMIGTGGAGKLVGLAGKVGLPVATLSKYPWLARILGGAVGGETGADISGETPGKGALVGGGGAAVAEGVGALAPLTGLLRRSTAAGRSAIAADDAARVGAAIEKVAPTLQPGTTAEAMQRTAEGQGLARIGAGKEAAVSDIEAALNAAPAQVPHFTNAQGQGFVRGAQPGQWSPARQPGEIPIPSLGKNMTLRDANAELSSIGDQMRGLKPLDPRFPKDANLKQEYGRLAEEIKSGLAQVAGPDAAAKWTAAQGNYQAGRNVTEDLLQRPRLFRQGEFNLAELQRWLTNPEHRADLAWALKGDLGTGQNLGPYNTLVSAIERGAAPGMVDELAGRAPGLLSGRGSYGSWRAPAELIRKIFPNASSTYVGQLPARYSTTPLRGDVQTLLDMMGEQAAGGASRYVGAGRQ